jgi:nucleoid-associated protein YgaU
MGRSISPYEQFGEVAPVTDSFLALHVFDASETITGLAHRYYEDWTLWRLIADRNGIIDPRQIAPGTQLLIPEKPRELGSFESR